MDRHTFVKAAHLYRSLRRRGITIRKPLDCMIAAVAIEHSIPLLHNDKDFEPIEKFCGLLVLNPETNKAQLYSSSTLFLDFRDGPHVFTLVYEGEYRKRAKV